MIFKKYSSQLLFEDLINIPQIDRKSSRINNHYISPENYGEIKDKLKIDSLNHLDKAVVSIVESLFAIENNIYSWSTVKLYYSIFYLLRSSLAIKGHGAFRFQRDMFFIDINDLKFKKIDALHKSDHKAVIYLQKKYYSDNDKLLSSLILDKDVYSWMAEQREYVNYKHYVFEEPNTYDIWNKIKTSKDNNNLLEMIKDFYASDDCIHSFDPEYSILATPINLLKNTIKDLKMAGIESIISTVKLDYLNETYNNCDCVNNVLESLDLF